MLPCCRSTPPASGSGRRSSICSFQHLKGLKTATDSVADDSVVIVIGIVDDDDDDDHDDSVFWGF